MLENKVAVVTGGTRGIGLAIVKRFLEEGAKVALLGSRMETVNHALDELKEEVEKGTVLGFAPNLNDEQEVRETFQKIKETFGHFDILVNNAGMSSRTPLYQYDAKEFQKIIDLNLNSVFTCSKEAAMIMKEQQGGVILNTSSMVSLYGQPSGVGYPASKFAVNGLTKSLARELGKDHIRVNAVAPGVVNTDMVKELPKEMIEPIIKTIPLGRMAEPVDIANAFVFLASDMASYITGAILSVDGATMV